MADDCTAALDAAPENHHSSFACIEEFAKRRVRLVTRIEDFDAAVAAHVAALDAMLVTAKVKHMVRIAGEDWSE